MQALKADGDTCSLLQLADLVKRCRGVRVDALIGYVIKAWILLHHFAVVRSRSVPSDGKNRFRFMMGDYGL